MKTAKEILDRHTIIGDEGLESAIIAAMDEYANQPVVVVINDIKERLDKNCSEFDDNVISYEQSDPV